MTEKKNQGEAGSTRTQRVDLGVRLHPAAMPEQRVYSNLTVVQAGQGAVFVDFGFVEPAALNAVIRAVQTGTNAPDNISGQLSCRVALSVDAAAQLAQQLAAVLKPRAGKPAAATEAKTAES
ncbi:MAG TPA: hypothetical protein DCR14_08375 [Acidimicrobiaceae bacterium]|nr:hypothetical protein [Acidimicrobiaceae bacterium]